ncbi:MAG: hypothetical protein KDK36_19835, partial [Leptospiraceae bacterium]|nr:hypothetical protein [Leptospiraceae bacterium]
MKLILTGKIKAFLISLPFIIYFLYKIFLEDHSEHNGVFAETRDGKTYLSIDKIKEGCEKVEVDGVPWK